MPELTKTTVDSGKFQILAGLITDGLTKSEPDMLAVLKALQIGYCLGEMKAVKM